MIAQFNMGPDVNRDHGACFDLLVLRESSTRAEDANTQGGPGGMPRWKIQKFNWKCGYFYQSCENFSTSDAYLPSQDSSWIFQLGFRVRNGKWFINRLLSKQRKWRGDHENVTRKYLVLQRTIIFYFHTHTRTSQ